VILKCIQARRPLRLAILAAAAVAALGGCGRGNHYQPPPAPAVTVAKPLSLPVTDYLEATGSVAASKTVDLVARVEGYLRSVDFKDGSLVKSGQLLFVIEPEPYQAKLASQQAQLANAQSEYERQLRMIKENATSQANVEKWRSQRDQDAAAVTLAKINLGYTRITAPFAGRIDRHLVDPERPPSLPPSSRSIRPSFTSASTSATCCGCAPRRVPRDIPSMPSCRQSR
jgi:multidrug efflux pump subunit AcrA (membrane-fusion protein)